MNIPTGFISSHELVGIVDELGDEVTNFKVGDECVVPFFTACGNCFFYKRWEASRYPNGKLFGNSQGNISIDGGQAEYV
jgi:threonine dehydrogenase-like Zn-dependent dehydrogenase